MTSRLDYMVGDKDGGQLVQVSALPAQTAPTVISDLIWKFAAKGNLFISSDADDNDLVTAGQTSYAATTPTWVVDVPLGRTVIPLFVNLSQSGSVAGGAVDVIISIDRDNTRRSSGGTVEKVYGVRKGRSTPVAVYSTNPTASSGYGIRVWAATIGQDVSPAEGAVPGPFWRPEIPLELEGPASLLIYTYAASTAPTWYWSIGFGEFLTSERDQWLGS